MICICGHGIEFHDISVDLEGQGGSGDGSCLFDSSCECQEFEEKIMSPKREKLSITAEEVVKTLENFSIEQADLLPQDEMTKLRDNPVFNIILSQLLAKLMVSPLVTLVTALDFGMLIGAAIIDKRKKENSEALEIIKSLRNNAPTYSSVFENCWCEMGINNPMVGSHSKACERAKLFVKENSHDNPTQ